MLSINTATEKEFASLRAQAALHGHELHRSNPADGKIRYWASRLGVTHDLKTIDEVRNFMRQLLG